MKQLAYVLGLVAALTLAACGGSSSVDIGSYFPADDEVAGWTEDPADAIAGVAVAEGRDAAEELVDGDVEPFAASGFVAFAWQLYVNGDRTMDFRIWEMADAAGCAALYADLVATWPVYQANTWVDESVGDLGRSAETASKWLVNACADKYFLEAKVVKAGGSTDDEAHTLAVAFVQAVDAKIP